jgi:CRISPR-associated protein Cas1
LSGLPLRPRCDRPDFERIARAIEALGTVANPVAHSGVLRAEYRHYAKSASRPYAWRPFCMQFRLWEKSLEAKRVDDTKKWFAAFEESDDFWRGIAAPKGRHIVLLHGEVATIKVRGGELRLWSGDDDIIFAPGDRMPSAIVFSGYGGTISLAAIRFCKDHHIALAFLDWPQDILTFMGPPPSMHAALVRRQTLADPVKMARAFIARKIEHSLATGRLTASEAGRFDRALCTARTVAAVMTIEARAAKIYWSRFDIRLEPRKGGKLPAHWQTIAGRVSSLGPGAKRATRPINAMLNFAYSIELGRLAAALHASGTCLAIGYLHSDKPGRLNFAYDALEPLRPMVDANVAKWIAAHKFAPGDFIRMRSGGVTLGAALSKVFAQAVALPQSDIERGVRFAIKLLFET